jgi:hypothetical protein
MQEKILDEVASMIATLKSDMQVNDGKIADFNLSPHLSICVGSIINSLLFGYRFDKV